MLPSSLRQVVRLRVPIDPPSRVGIGASSLRVIVATSSRSIFSVVTVLTFRLLCTIERAWERDDAAARPPPQSRPKRNPDRRLAALRRAAHRSGLNVHCPIVD